MRRTALLIAIVALASLGLAIPVAAAAPNADLYGGRTLIAAIPFADSIDTSEATTDADDLEAVGPCGPVPTDASVWFEYTATSDAGFIVDTSSSSYSAGIVVVTGTPGSFDLVTCDGISVQVPTNAGQTYEILVFDYQGDGEGNGGTLNISLGEVPPPPELDVTVAPTGHFNAKTGVATIHGTLTCVNGDQDGKNYIDLQVTQSIGRIRFSGEGWTTFACDGTAETWSIDVSSSIGKFGGGKATVSMFAVASGPGGSDVVEASVTVTLKR